MCGWTSVDHHPLKEALYPQGLTVGGIPSQRAFLQSVEARKIRSFVDLSKMERPPQLESISDRRTHFLVNTFVIHTVRLLNNFAVICEDKLADVHRRIVRADATLTLLEAKLRSVDGLEGVGEQAVEHPDLDLDLFPGTPESSEPHLSTESSMTQSELSRLNSNPSLPALDQPELLKTKDDPRFTRFFRMLQVGVPLPAVKIQMGLEGLDGSMLDSVLENPAGHHDEND